MALFDDIARMSAMMREYEDKILYDTIYAALCSKCTKAVTGVITRDTTACVCDVPLQIGARACL